VNVVALVALGRSVEQEIPALAADLGVTAYEAGMMLRAPPPVIVLRSEDRTRTANVLEKLRSRGHDAVACDLESVVSSEHMFRPKSFRLDGESFIGTDRGEERRLSLDGVFAFVRATHSTRNEDTVIEQHRKISLGRTALTGGMVRTRTVEMERKRVTQEREPVLYVFRHDAAPWLLASTQMRYDGLAEAMKLSKIENFEVLLRILRERAPSAPFDTRLLSIRANPTVVSASPKRLSTSSSSTLDVLAHIVAIAQGRAARPYR
jgi:hypothetical protein